MKLFKKIFLQVFAGCILLTMIPLLYFLYESNQQNLKSVYLYEAENLKRNGRQFGKRLQQGQQSGESQEIRDLVAIQEFRSLMGIQGALYRDGIELYNMSPYEFDAEGIRRKVFGGDNTITGIMSDADHVFRRSIQKINGRKLMVLGEEWNGADALTYYVVYYKDVTDVYQRTENLLFKGLFFAAVLLAVIGVVLYFGIYRSIRPLMELRQTAAFIADGAYESRAPIRGKDEIGELAVSFNRMAEKVEEHVEELSHTNRMQRQLIASLAHELKTPMTAVIGYSDTLLTVPLSEKRRIQALSYIRSEGRRLARLSSKMMELTGLYEGETSISLKKTGAEEFLRRLKDLTAYRLREKNIGLTVSCHPKDLLLRIDEDLMMSLMMNLVDNAYKASAEGSTIAVSADERGLSVEDTGRGIPRAEIERVTEAFYMVDKSRAKSAGSVGLGLAFCKQIAALHGARLLIESEEGRGTRVSVTWVYTDDGKNGEAVEKGMSLTG